MSVSELKRPDDLGLACEDAFLLLLVSCAFCCCCRLLQCKWAIYRLQAAKNMLKPAVKSFMHLLDKASLGMFSYHIGYIVTQMAVRINQNGRERAME